MTRAAQHTRSKYGARKTVVDGITFASGKEARRYAELRLLERAKVIQELILQPRYVLQDAFRSGDGEAVRKIEYVGDFRYIEKGREVCEDVKGVRTDVYKLKRKLFMARYPEIELREV